MNRKPERPRPALAASVRLLAGSLLLAALFWFLTAPPATAAEIRLAFLDRLFGKGGEGGVMVESLDGETSSTNPQYASGTNLENVTRLHRDMPFKDPLLEYTIRLPKDWDVHDLFLSTTPQLSNRLLGDIARFYGPAAGLSRPYIAIQAAEMQHEMTATDWLKNHMYTNGFTVIGDIPSPNDDRAYASYIFVEEGEAYQVFSAAQIHGARILLVQFAVPESTAAQYQAIQKYTVESFTMLADVDNIIENFAPYTLGGALRFNYPISWAVRNPSAKDDNNMSVELHNIDASGNSQGIIVFQVMRGDAQAMMQEKFGVFRTRLNADYGIVFEKLAGEGKAQPNPRFLLSKQEIYDVTISNAEAFADQKVWFTVLGDSQWLVFVALITPSQQYGYYNWARNTRAYELILSTIR